MVTLDKNELWKAMKEPLDRFCHNCKRKYIFVGITNSDGSEVIGCSFLWGDSFPEKNECKYWEKE